MFKSMLFSARVCIIMCEAQDLLALRSVCSRKSFLIHSIVCDNFREKFRGCDDSYRILTAFLHLRQNAAGIVEEFSKCRLIEQWSEFASTFRGLSYCAFLLQLSSEYCVEGFSPVLLR